MSIKVVVFDAGKVIFDYDLSKFINAYAKKIPGNSDIDISKEILEYSHIAKAYEQGNISSLDFYQELKKKTHYTGSYNEFSVIWNNIFKPIEGTIEIIALLARKNYKLGMLSNTNELHITYLREQYPDLFALFYKLHLSYEMGMRKPNDDIYEEIINYYDIDPSEMFFTDDLEQNVSAALAKGIKAYQFISPSKLIEDLKKENIEI